MAQLEIGGQPLIPELSEGDIISGAIAVVKILDTAGTVGYVVVATTGMPAPEGLGMAHTAVLSIEEEIRAEAARDCD